MTKISRRKLVFEGPTNLFLKRAYKGLIRLWLENAKISYWNSLFMKQIVIKAELYFQFIAFICVN